MLTTHAACVWPNFQDVTKYVKYRTLTTRLNGGGGGGGCDAAVSPCQQNRIGNNSFIRKWLMIGLMFLYTCATFGDGGGLCRLGI